MFSSSRFFGIGLTRCHFLTSSHWLVLIVSFLSVSGCENPPEPNRVRQLSVSVLSLNQAGPAKIEDRFTGAIVPSRTSFLAAKRLSRVERVFVDIGDQVASGDLLVQLDENELKARLEVAQANLAAEHERMAELKNGSTLPRKFSAQELRWQRCRRICLSPRQTTSDFSR